MLHINIVKTKFSFANTLQKVLKSIKEELLKEIDTYQSWLAEQQWKKYNRENGYGQNLQQPRLEPQFIIDQLLEIKPKEFLKKNI